ncbi:hypothetical protein FQN55_006281 [Onygenales sp. PD_40]|nr:hypothetical protein FQN55_006281 [Onygenales sp. PD_40]
MPLNTLTVGAAVTPTVLSTWLSHYMHRKSHSKKPTARISYHEGLQIIRQFLEYASLHPVESLQMFTAQWVPSPSWVKVDSVVVPQDFLKSAADILTIQLGAEGVSEVGGSKWWQWRGAKPSLQGEWVEMRSDFNERRTLNVRCNRIMFYIHGGGYYFGSLNSHRYQVQRHARKLKARVFARGRDASVVSPSEYTYDEYSADSSRILVTLRDQRLPLPAGAILISPWVDLTHSFPSTAENGDGDYVPPHGFIHRPSMAWPPPNSDEIEALSKASEMVRANRRSPASAPLPHRVPDVETAVRGFSIRPGFPFEDTGRQSPRRPTRAPSIVSENYDIFPNQGTNLEIEIEGAVVEIKDQMHMYTTNQLLSHPLVSPILQPSLGGLPPLLVLTGGAELLRDEQIYLAHKAADPACFLPSRDYLDLYDPQRQIINKYPPTFVQLQVWDDLCHVPPTLSFTRPAKYMFRSIAQFGAWALARAQHAGINIPQPSELSSSDADNWRSSAMSSPSPYSGFTMIGKAGDPLPPFRDHMIRQRVDENGKVYKLAERAFIPALQLLPEEIGVLKPGPMRKWLIAKQKWDTKYSKEKIALQQQRLDEMFQGIGVFRSGEYPPPCSLASMKEISPSYYAKEHKKSQGMWLWSLLGSRHDAKTLRKEHRDARLGPGDVQPGFLLPNKPPSRMATIRKKVVGSVRKKKRRSDTQPRTRAKTVMDLGQATESLPVLAPPPRSELRSQTMGTRDGSMAPTPPGATTDEHGPGFATGSRFVNHFGDAGGRSSSEYTDDMSSKAVTHARGTIRPVSPRTRSESEFRTPLEHGTPTAAAVGTGVLPSEAPPTPSPAPTPALKQDAISSQLAGEGRNFVPDAVPDGLQPTKRSEKADAGLKESPRGYQLFGKQRGQPKYDFDSFEQQHESDMEPFPDYRPDHENKENM